MGVRGVSQYWLILQRRVKLAQVQAGSIGSCFNAAEVEGEDCDQE